jgi:hypothetical protein
MPSYAEPVGQDLHQGHMYGSGSSLLALLLKPRIKPVYRVPARNATDAARTCQQGKTHSQAFGIGRLAAGERSKQVARKLRVFVAGADQRSNAVGRRTVEVQITIRSLRREKPVDVGVCWLQVNSRAAINNTVA